MYICLKCTNFDLIEIPLISKYTYFWTKFYPNHFFFREVEQYGYPLRSKLKKSKIRATLPDLQYFFGSITGGGLLRKGKNRPSMGQWKLRYVYQNGNL